MSIQESEGKRPDLFGVVDAIAAATNEEGTLVITSENADAIAIQFQDEARAGNKKIRRDNPEMSGWELKKRMTI